MKKHLLAALVCLVLSIAMTWPLAFAIDRAVAYPGDPFINTWILDWDWYATFHQPLDLFNANLFYPAKNSLAFSENLYGIALLLFPLRALGVAPLTAYNVAILLGFAFSAFATYLLGRMITGSWIAGIAAGIFYAFVPWRFTQLPHVQHVWGGWVPMLLVALLYYARTPSWRNAALFGGAFLMNGLSNIHWLLLGSLAVALTVPIVLKPRDWIRIGVATLIAIALLSPFLIPYAQVAKEYGMQRGWEEAKHYSATLSDWLNPGVTNRFYRRFANVEIDAERWLFPGALSIVLSIAALAKARTERRSIGIALLWVALGIVGSLGLHAFLHRFLFVHAPGFRAIRVPARWANIGYVGMSMLIAIAIAWIALHRRAAAYVVTILFIVELRAAPIRWYVTSPKPPQVYRWLATQNVKLAELPIGLFDFDFLYMLRATAHHRPMINGMSGFVPPELQRITDMWSGHENEQLFNELRRIGIDRVLIHADLLGDRSEEMRAFLKKQLDEGRIQFAGRFNSNLSGDWVFALSGPPRPRTPELEAYLRGELTFTNETFGILDYPRFGETLNDGVMFSGWAVSPWGIRKVDLLFDNGQVRVPTKRIEDPGVTKALPWYPATPRPRFIARFDRRPWYIRPDTDVQVEITDGNGNKTVWDGRPINWIR